MNEGEHVQSFVAPAVRVTQSWLEGGPVDTQNPEVAQDKPDNQERGEQEVCYPGAGGGGEAVLGGSRGAIPRV